MDWTPTEIKVALLRKNITQAYIAQEAEVSPTSVARVVNSAMTSDKIRRAIAEALGVDVARIWPSVYLQGGPPKRGRPRITPKKITADHRR